MATTSAIALTGVTAIGAYLNGKYHIAQDLKAKRRRKQAVDYYAGLGTFLSSPTEVPTPICQSYGQRDIFFVKHTHFSPLEVRISGWKI
jgi:hypothetical protein